MPNYTTREWIDGTWDVMDGIRVCVAGLQTKGQAENVISELVWALENGKSVTD